MAQLAPHAITMYQSQLAELIILAEAGVPREVCGLFSGKRGLIRRIIPIENVSMGNSTFIMDPRAQVAAFHLVENLDEEIIGIYHSHPMSSAYPSPRDLDECMYLDIPQIIIGKDHGKWVVQAFSISGKDYREIQIKVIPD